MVCGATKLPICYTVRQLIEVITHLYKQTILSLKKKKGHFLLQVFLFLFLQHGWSMHLFLWLIYGRIADSGYIERYPYAKGCIFSYVSELAGYAALKTEKQVKGCYSNSSQECMWGTCTCYCHLTDSSSYSFISGADSCCPSKG